MGKLPILSLDESEQNLYSKIMKIVNESGICTDKIIDQEQSEIGIGELAILPAQLVALVTSNPFYSKCGFRQEYSCRKL